MAGRPARVAEFTSGILLGTDLGTDIAYQLRAGRVPNGDYVSEVKRRLAKADSVTPEIVSHATSSAIDVIESFMGWA